MRTPFDDNDEGGVSNTHIVTLSDEYKKTRAAFFNLDFSEQLNIAAECLGRAAKKNGDFEMECGRDNGELFIITGTWKKKGGDNE